MIRPLKIADKIFPVNLIQGPLAGVSCAPFRLLTSLYSRPAFTCTEMISCKTILHQPELALRRYVSKAPKEGPVCFQLAGNDTQEVAAAVKRVTDFGADLIDLNCGCPVKKIRRKGAGSSLLASGSQLFALINAMKKNTHVPVGIKIRVDGNSSENYNLEIARIVADAGADFLIVHGRHWAEDYSVPCHYDQIQFFVQNLKIPVIGNGDIACLATLQKMLATGCAGAMISRAGVGQPWLIGQLIAADKQDPFQIPGIPEIGILFVQHVTMLAELLDSETHAILQARKLAKYYARRLSNRAQFCDEINLCGDLENFKKICARFF